MIDREQGKQPTPEQIREFWEWCGFIQTDFVTAPARRKDYHWEFGERVGNWHRPDGSESDNNGRLPAIDLNNLFKYAVLTLFHQVGPARWAEIMYNWIDTCCLRDLLGDDRTCALALFWAIREVIHAK